MNALLLTAWLVSGGAASPDTTVELRRGDRVVVEGISGELRVETWDRAAMDIRGEDEDPIGVSASRAGDRVVLRATDRKRRGFDVDAGSIRAKTLSGDVFFSGPLAAGGSYWFSVHDGDADFELPSDSGAEVTVSTFDGEFTSDFPVVVQRYGGGGVFDFTLGNGGARLEIQVFDGEIELRNSEGR